MKRERALSELVGIVLLFGIVLVGATTLLVVGSVTVSDSEQVVEQERIENGFVELDKRIDAVARSEAARRQMDLDLPDTGGAAVRETDDGRIVVTRTNFTSGTITTIVNQSIGSISYTSPDGQEVAYQSGGVWRGSGNQTTMISAPAFTYDAQPSGDNPTLTLPIVETTGDRRLTNGKLEMAAGGTRGSANNVSIVEGQLVTVTIQSDYYVGWAEYFSEIVVPSAVSVDHSTNTAIVRLFSRQRRRGALAGVVSNAEGQNIVFGNNMRMDSYDSRNGNYTTTKRDETNVMASGNLVLENSANVSGEVNVGQELRFNHPQARVHGDAHVEGSITPGPDPYVTGTYDTDADITDFEPVDSIIDAIAGAANDPDTEPYNNNSAAPDITGNTLDNCTPECDLWPGTYYLDKLHFGSQEKLVIHVPDKNRPVNVVVDGRVLVNGSNTVSDAGIEVVGPGRVNFFVDSATPNASTGGNYDVRLTQTRVMTPNQSAPQMWWYTKKRADVLIEGGQSDFVGVVFGPGSGNTATTDGTDIQVENQANVYGALVGDVNAAGNKVGIHFDEALAETQKLGSIAKFPAVTFLHAPVYNVSVSNR